MTVINTSPNKLIQIGYEGEDKVTILRFSYSDKWLENGEGIFTVRVLRNGENQAYNAQVIKDDRENYTIDMTVTDIELSKKGYGEMQLVYTGADFVKKSPVYKYYVSRSVDDVVDPPEGDVYTQIIESLADLRVDFNELSDMVSEINDDIGDITELTTANKLNIVESINEVNSKSSVSVDDELSDESTNPVQNKVITSRITSAESAIASAQTAIHGKADIQIVSALSDAVNGLDSDVQGLQTTVQAKADTATVTALSGTVSGLQTTVQSKADTSTVTALSGTVSALSDAAQQYMEQTSAALSDLKDYKANTSDVSYELATKADKSYVDTQLAGKVGDVQVNGSSIVSDGVASILKATGTRYGAVRFNGDYGIGAMEEWPTPRISKANSSEMKGGTQSYAPIVPFNQHESTFYGLAKVAGHDEKNSALPVGTYSDEAKVAIQKMLGIYEAPWELIREDTFTNTEEADHIITVDGNGDAFELTDLIILFETPKQETYSAKGYYGHIWCYYGTGENQYLSFECGAWTQNANDAYHSCGGMIENKGGIIESTIIQNSASANRAPMMKRLMSGFALDKATSFTPTSLTFKKITIRAVTGTGHYKLYGKRKWQ